MKIVNLRVANLVQPFGLDESTPLFSWNIETIQAGYKQQACRVVLALSLADAQNGVNAFWDSGRIEVCEQRLTYSGIPFTSDTQYYWCVTVWQADNTKTQSLVSWFHTGLLNAKDWQGKWLGEAEDGKSHIWQGDFNIPNEIASARLFICGLGHYEAYINGEKISDRVLEPGWTAYDKTILYSSYDVTAMLAEGANAIGVILADGMFNVSPNTENRHVYFERSFGKMKLLAQLNITLKNGQAQSFFTSEEWLKKPSAYTFCGIYGGEDVDLRLETPDFSKPIMYNAANEGWQAATIVAPPYGVMSSQQIPPCKVMHEYSAKLIGTPSENIVVYDFGTNFSGWPQIKVSGGQAGSKIRLYPAELLGVDGLPNQSITKGKFCWNLTLAGKEQTIWSPKFSYYGFRYLAVEGVALKSNPSLPIVQEIKGQFIYPDVELAGEFNCSNELFNQIHGIVRQAMLSNMKSYLTDCPHREKLSWMEQTHLIGPGLLYNFDLMRLYSKIEQDIADTQYDNGLIPDICPQYVKFGYHKGFNDSPEWGSAGIVNPWLIYCRYDDLSLLKRYYHTMCKYLDYLTGKAHHHVLHHGLGDWLDIGPCPPHSQNTPVPVIATCMYALDISIMLQVARLLGKSEDEARFAALFDAVREEFRAQFLDTQNEREIWVANGSQAAQAMALMCGMINADEEAFVVQCLVKDIEKRGWATTAGDVGHPFVLAALTKYGRGDVVANMAIDTERPGYGYQVKHGATTLTEDWDGSDNEHPHGSQNHFMLGAIEEWFASGLAGFGVIREKSAINVMRIAPSFVQQCDEVTAWTLHPYGRVELQWKRIGEKISILLVVPAGLEIVFCANGNEQIFTNGRHSFELTKSTQGAS